MHPLKAGGLDANDSAMQMGMNRAGPSPQLGASWKQSGTRKSIRACVAFPYRAISEGGGWDTGIVWGSTIVHSSVEQDLRSLEIGRW